MWRSEDEILDQVHARAAVLRRNARVRASAMVAGAALVIVAILAVVPRSDTGREVRTLAGPTAATSVTSAPTGSTSEPATTPPAAPETTASTEDTSTTTSTTPVASSAPTAPTTRVPGSIPPAAPVVPPRCQDSEIRFEPPTAAPAVTYAPGQRIDLRLPGIINTSGHDCLLPSMEAWEVKDSSGAIVSTMGASAGRAGGAAWPPGPLPNLTQMWWDQTCNGSSPSCKDGHVSAGTYTISRRVDSYPPQSFTVVIS